MDRHDYVKLDGIALAALIKAGEVSADEVAGAARAQIAFANPQINAVIAAMEPGPLADAASLRDLPFAGVPFLLKDIGAAAAGQVTSCASRFYADRGSAAAVDSELTRRFRSAGLRLMGKSNLPELGFNVTTEPLLFGPTRNPWNLAHSAGGSSGGAAAAVASGMVPLAHATDGAGSIRIPAAACGLIGLKPSRGALPQGPDAADVYGGLVSEGVITRTVRDTALALDITFGADAGAPYASPMRPASFLAELDKKLPPLRVGISMMVPADVSLSVASGAATDRAAAMLRQLGHEVSTVDLPLSAAELLMVRDIYGMHVCAQAAADVRALEQGGLPSPQVGNMEQINLAAAARGAQVTAADFLLMERQRHRLTRKMARLRESCDFLLTPALAGPAPELGCFPTDHDDVTEHVARMLRFSPFTALFNVTGDPAVTVPVPSEDALPVGVQLVGQLGDDARLLCLAADVERVSGGAGADRVATAFR